MHSLNLSIAEGCDLVLHVSDFNRLRWTVYAIEANPDLRHLLKRHASSSLYDSTSIASQRIEPAANAYVILWDGLNSYQEFLKDRPDLQQRSDLTYLYVGSFAEISQALHANSHPLFPRSEKAIAHAASTPLSFRAKVRAKTAARRFKNLVADHARHSHLASGNNIVFCGLVRPTPAVIANMLTTPKLMTLQDSALKLGAIHWSDDPERVSTQVQAVYLLCKGLNANSAEDYCGIYSMLNICSRLTVINQLHAAGRQMFISEYGFQRNFDAYDTYAYGNNTFLDFGSSRGACLWYPRTMDMRATGKDFIAIRFIQENQSLGHYLATHSDTDYMMHMRAEASRITDGLN